MNSTDGYAPVQCLPAWCEEPEQSCSFLRAKAFRKPVAWLEWDDESFGSGFVDLMTSELKGSETNPAGGENPFFPTEVALHLVKIACEMPDQPGRSLSLRDCRQLAHKLEKDGVVQSLSAETIKRILNNHHLKPWRHHMSPGDKTHRDEAFCVQVQEICDLYTKGSLPYEMLLCLDEKTSLQPRSRKQPAKPARSDTTVRVEHEYNRRGALNLFAAFDTRTGRVNGRCFRRKRQPALIIFLDYLDGLIPDHITRVHIVCDNLDVHKGKQVLKWLSKHPRFAFHFTPVHCSWMNQVEQWFGILQPKRSKIANSASIEDLFGKIHLFIDQWNHWAHPFKWTTKSVARIIAYAKPRKKAA